VIFFAYVGFDNVSAAAQEAKNPQRDMPIGLLGCLAVCSLLFIGVSAVLTAWSNTPGSASTRRSSSPCSRSTPRLAAHQHRDRHDRRPDLGLLGLAPRPAAHLFSMAKDGLLPPSFSKIHPRFRTRTSQPS